MGKYVSICMFSFPSRVINVDEGWFAGAGCRMHIYMMMCVTETFSVGVSCVFNETQGIVKYFSCTIISSSTASSLFVLSSEQL